jgi:hypothetical protein
MRHISEFIDEALRDAFEERAGIREFCGLQPRETAEAAAMAEINERRSRQNAVDRDKVQK